MGLFNSHLSPPYDVFCCVLLHLVPKVGKPFSDFLQRLTKAVEVEVTDPEASCVLIKPLTFENANLECKKIFGHQ